MTELHEALAASDLTTLRLCQREALELTLTKDFEPDLDFASYPRFTVDAVPCRSPRVLNDREARALVPPAALAHLETLMRAGRHEMLTLRVHARLGMRAALAVHSSVLGRANGLHAIRAGGVRRHEPHEPEGEVLLDALNLGRAMSFKNAAAELPLGGCKMTVQCAPFPLADRERLGFLAYAIDAGHFVTGPDMGFSPELADALRARFTRHIVGGTRGPLGPTGTPTARGCFLAIREAARVALGSDDLRGRRVAIQGLGAVGLHLARHLRDAGARLTVADPDSGRVEAACETLGPLEVVSPAEILLADVEILAPCAIGGILDAATIDRLRCRLVYGSANNQLKAVSKDEELALAERLAKRGILYQPDWTHNTAGVMAGFEEYRWGEEASLERVLARVERVVLGGTREILRESRETGRTPTAVAYARVERAIYPEG